MARVFTTSFEFNHRQYDAIVTVLTQGEQVNFTIKILGDNFHDFFPNGEIAYTGTTGFEQVDAFDNTVAQSLLRKVGEAVRHHLVLLP